MAPKRTAATAAPRKQVTLQGFGRVTKHATASGRKKKSVAPAQVVEPRWASPVHSNKRRRDHDEDDLELSLGKDFASKKPRLPLPTPPSSQSSETSSRLPTPVRDLDIVLDRPRAPEELSTSLTTILDLHRCFLKALSIHFAHNGLTTPASLPSLLTSMTKIWKKQQVKLEDVQRMLALYEVSSDLGVLPATCLRHKSCPFRLNRTPAGVNVEYVGESQGGPISFNERCLDVGYEMDLHTLVLQSRTKPVLTFLKESLFGYPLLQITTGNRTAAAQHRVQTLRDGLLGRGPRTQTKDLTASTISSEPADAMAIPTSVKSRTLSLFDRIKQKQLANSTTTKPTADSILRRHAIGRIGEVVDILRMKQQQKLSGMFISAVHVSPSKVKSRVSFSLVQLVREIRNSVAVPIGEAEVVKCLEILADESPGFWITLIKIGSGTGNAVRSVVLNGAGVNGKEIQRSLDEKDRSDGILSS